MAKRIVNTKQQYQAALREMTRQLLERLEEVRVNSAEEFVAYCLKVLAYAVALAPRGGDGTLRNTAYLELNGAVIATGPGGGAVPDGAGLPLRLRARVVFPAEYALRQHERPDLQHPQGGQAFFLQIGLAEATREYLQHAYQAIRR